MSAVPQNLMRSVYDDHNSYVSSYLDNLFEPRAMFSFSVQPPKKTKILKIKPKNRVAKLKQSRSNEDDEYKNGVNYRYYIPQNASYTVAFQWPNEKSTFFSPLENVKAKVRMHEM